MRPTIREDTCLLYTSYGDDAPLPADQILSMNWLSAYVEGRIPAFDELTPKAQELVKLQGIQGLEGSVDP